MQYTRLGSSGLKVSRLCLGCMSFGEPGRGRPLWSLGEDASRPLIQQALEAGINFFDTANMYSDGSSEEIVGRAIADFARRDEVVLATKVYFPMGGDANATGLSRKAIMREIDASLRRLGTDYIDLYQIHRFDPGTPIEETMEALHDVVKAGKASYIGASSMAAWQFARMMAVAERNGWTRFVSMQNMLNLLYREEEREMLPLCEAEGVGVIPYSPLARGRLARDVGEETDRDRTDEPAREMYDPTAATDAPVIDAAAAVAKQLGVSRASAALAWLLRKPMVAAPIVGVTKAAQLTDGLAALDLTLDQDQAAALETKYVPHAVSQA